ISLKYGPDGNMYMIDWYDKNQCHHREIDGHDRTNGRIFKIVFDGSKPRHGARLADLGKAGEGELLDLLRSPNEFDARHARRILEERGASEGLRRSLADLAFASDGSDGVPIDQGRLRGLWALHAVGGLDEGAIARGLANDRPHVRAWTIQLALEGKDPSST